MVNRSPLDVAIITCKRFFIRTSSSQPSLPPKEGMSTSFDTRVFPSLQTAP